MVYTRFASAIRQTVAKRSMASSTGAVDEYYASTMLPSAYAARQHAKGSVSFWRKFNYFFTVPALLAVAVYSMPPELEHIKHLKEHPNEFHAFPYLRKRKVPFPYGDGDHTPFHSSHANADPSA
ncbi:cytochrome c oxidase, subunit VIa [Polychytrium aggregatum]|uniref:cytochrome c oxidase, subunit VIa n=1 Tax=Polychytrium aggregatum TaxID=110093 RepID=UPI0022FE2063|nr:cytochrome c oxidase, subunit VIa [Polychytrium aggregatum]KAI9193270.1 cytochrome c oxidase, subunit VIa [Polychytrium aggregatum]